MIRITSILVHTKWQLLLWALYFPQQIYQVSTVMTPFIHAKLRGWWASLCSQQATELGLRSGRRIPWWSGILDAKMNDENRCLESGKKCRAGRAEAQPCLMTAEWIKSMNLSPFLDYGTLSVSESPRYLFLDSTISQDLSLEVVTQMVLVAPEISAVKSSWKWLHLSELVSQVAFHISFQVPGTIPLPCSRFAT